MSGANNSPLSALLKGVLTSFILTFIVFTVYAILLTYTSLQENNVNVVMLVSTAISCILCFYNWQKSLQ